MADKRKQNFKEKAANKLSLKKFKDIKGELKKVTWPTWSQLVSNTLTVIVACLLIGSIIWLFDAAIGKIISLTLLG